MSFESPTRSSSTLDRYLHHRSGSMSGHSPTIYHAVPTKPKKFQSAHYDETTGKWRCKHCRYTYPNPEPHHHQRREHKKICPGYSGKVHHSRSLSAGEETENSQETFNVGDKPSMPETPDSATSKLALAGGHAKSAGCQSPQLPENPFEFQGTPSTSEHPKESEIQELEDPNGTLSGPHGLVAAGAHSEAQRKEKLDAEPVSEKDVKPSSRHFGRLRTLDSDFSLPRELAALKLGQLDLSADNLGRLRTLDSDFSFPRELAALKSDPLDFSASLNAENAASDSKEGKVRDEGEPVLQGSGDETLSLKAGKDILTADDALKERTEVAQGNQPTPSSSDEQALKDLGDWSDKRDPGLDATDDSTQEKTADVLRQVEGSHTEPSFVTADVVQERAADVLQQDEESQTTATESGNCEELLQEVEERGLTVTGNGENAEELLQQVDESQIIDTEDENVESRVEVGKSFGETEAIVPAAADDGAVREKEQEVGYGQDPAFISGDGRELPSGDEHESSQSFSGVEDDEALQREISTDQSDKLVHASEEVGKEALQLETATDQLGEMVHAPEEVVEEALQLETAMNQSGEMAHAREEVGNEALQLETAMDQLGEMAHAREEVGNEDLQHETAADQSGEMVDAPEEVGDSDRHGDTGEVDGNSLEPLSDAAESAIELPANNGTTGPPLRLSSADRNWDDWQHVVSGDDMSGQDKVPSVSQEIIDAGPPFSEDGLTSYSESDTLEDNTADTSAPTPESGSVLTSDQDEDVGSQFGSHPAGLEWILPVPDTLKNASDRPQPVDSLEGSTSARLHSIPDQDGQELIPGLNQETDQRSKVTRKLSAAEANWDDWEDVIRRGPFLVEGLPGRKTEDSESSGHQTSQVDFFGDVSGLGQGGKGTVLESESFVEGGVIGTAAATGVPVHVPDSQNADWLIDFSEPSVEESDLKVANEKSMSPIAASSSEVDIAGPKFLYLLNLNDGSAHEQAESLLDRSHVTPQSGIGQSSQVLPRLSSALRNWEDWDDVVRESEHTSRSETKSAVLADGEPVHGILSPSPRDSSIVDIDNSKQVGSVASYPNDSGHEGRRVGKAASIPDESLLSVPQAELEPKLLSSTLEKNLSIADAGVGRPRERTEVDDDEDTSQHESAQAGEDSLWEDDWEMVQKNDHPPAGSRLSSPSFEDAQDGELSSDREDPTERATAVNLPLGKRRWADWEDLTKSEYMVLDGPDGDSLVFKRTSDDRDKLAAKALAKERASSPSFEEPDSDGRSPSLRRRRRQTPSMKGGASSPKEAVKPENSAQDLGLRLSTRSSVPASSPRKSELGDLPPLVTRRPLIYRGSRRDYASEVEEQDSTSKIPLGLHRHHHNEHDHNDALKYDVEKVLREQTTYELICPVCGALITRKIIVRKKKRRPTASAGEAGWGRGTAEITPVEDDGNRSTRSDISSEIEDLSGAWKQGIRPCLGYFFGSS